GFAFLGDTHLFNFAVGVGGGPARILDVTISDNRATNTFGGVFVSFAEATVAQNRFTNLGVGVGNSGEPQAAPGEPPIGETMISSNFMDDCKIAGVFVWTDLECGLFQCGPAPQLASHRVAVLHNTMTHNEVGVRMHFHGFAYRDGDAADPMQVRI